MKTYSKNIENAIHKHLADHEFFYSFDATKGVFMFPLGMDGKVSTLIYHVILHDHGFNTIAHFPLAPSPTDVGTMDSMIHFLSLANYALPNAAFQIDHNGGEIDVRFYCCCRGLDAPTDSMIAESITCYSKSIKKDSFRSCSPSNLPKKLSLFVKVTLLPYRRLRLSPNDTAQHSLWVLFSAERIRTKGWSLKTQTTYR